MIRQPPPQPTRHRRPKGGGRWIVIGVALTALVMAAAALGLPSLRSRGDASAARTDVSIGGIRLNFDPGLARASSDPPGGAVEALDLAAMFPDFSPAGASTGLTAASDPNARLERTVFLTITAAGKDIDPAERTGKLYGRFLEPEEWSHPGGLVMRRFVAGSPFEGEDLYLTPPEGKIFAARCMRPAAAADGLPDACLHDFRHGGLNVQLRFSPARLADWEILTQGARALVTRMRRAAGAA